MQPVTERFPDHWVARSAAVLWRRIGDVVVLLVRGEDELRRLEGVAAATWLVTEGPMRFDDLAVGACRAAGRADEDPAVLANLHGALDALEAAGLVAVSAERPATGPSA